MKCPECEKEGKRSKVYFGSWVPSPYFYQSFYDENGNFVYSDPRGLSKTEEQLEKEETINFWCSNDHKWEVKHETNGEK